jgi:hypothetical protein
VSNSNDFDSVRFYQAQRRRTQPDHVEHHRDGEPSGPSRNGVRIAIAVLVVIVVVWVVMLLLDPGSSEASNPQLLVSESMT